VNTKKTIVLVLMCFLTACAVITAPSPSTPTAVPPTFTSTSVPEVDVPGWWNNRVFYEVYVRSFYDSDGDGMGDLEGLIQKLDYLNDGDPATDDDLGITGVWLMPVSESSSLHGYDITDYYTVESDYGDNETFRRFVEAAHKRGIRVIVDLVLNHTSSQHPWFLDAASGPDTQHHNWYIWSETDPGYRGPWDQRVWHRRGNWYYYGVFGNNMPDLNYRNDEVTAQMLDVVRFWLEDMGVDGFRLDAIRHLIEEGPKQVNTQATHDWLRGFRRFYQGVRRNALTVGEVWDSTSNILPYLNELDLCFEFNLAGATIEAIKAEDPALLRTVQSAVVAQYPPGQYATFLTNHDQNRVMSQLGGDVNKARLAAIAYLTAPGVPFIFYGEEIGLTGVKPDTYIRRPMQWTAGKWAGFTAGPRSWQRPTQDYEGLNVEAELADPRSLLRLYQRLIRLRNEYTALRTGGWLPVASAERSVYAYLRHSEEPGANAFLVVLNFGAEGVSDYALSLDKSPLSGGTHPAYSMLDARAVQALQISADGHFDGYLPLPRLEPLDGVIIQLK